MNDIGNVLVFGGTTEGRLAVDYLLQHGFAVTVCVATEYGKDLLDEKRSNLIVHTGRMDETGMYAYMQKSPYLCVVDATHPYAVDVSRNIQNAAEAVSLPYIRLVREEGRFEGGVCFHTPVATATYLDGTNGPVLLTTGIKDLPVFCNIPDYKRRLYVRVLPSVESIEAAIRCGIEQSHIIAMQGPFGVELNKALILQFGIKHLVTKNSGAVGGFPEKVEACGQTGTELIVIDRPQEENGVRLEQLIGMVKGEM